MKNKIWALVCNGIMAGIVIYASSCSSVEKRIASDQQYYQSLSDLEKKRVLEYYPREGDDVKLVSLALGQPSKVSIENGTELWVYNKFFKKRAAADPSLERYYRDTDKYVELRLYVKDGKIDFVMIKDWSVYTPPEYRASISR